MFNNPWSDYACNYLHNSNIKSGYSYPAFSAQVISYGGSRFSLQKQSIMIWGRNFSSCSQHRWLYSAWNSVKFQKLATKSWMITVYYWKSLYLTLTLLRFLCSVTPNTMLVCGRGFQTAMEDGCVWSVLLGWPQVFQCIGYVEVCTINVIMGM